MRCRGAACLSGFWLASQVAIVPAHHAPAQTEWRVAGEFEAVIMIEGVTEEMHGSD